MKKLILLFFVFASFIISSQTIIKNDLYEIVYSETYEQPISVKYNYPNPFTLHSTQYSLAIDTIQASIKMGEMAVMEYQPIKFETISKGSFAFYTDKNGRVTSKKIYEDDPVQISFPSAKTTTIDTVITIDERIDWKEPEGINTSNSKDYKKPYDRGHMVPRASFKDDKYLNEIFSYVNCGIMHQSLNRGLWRVLEEKEREISLTGLLTVTIIPSFNSKSKIGNHGAVTPTHFTKILEYKHFDENENITLSREVYCFPNDSSVKGKKLKSYKIKELSY